MKDDLDLLIARYLEGEATPEEVERLDARLRRDPAARQELLLFAEQDGALRDLPRDAFVRSSGRRWAIAGGLAAALALAAVGATLLRPRPEPPAAPASAVAPAPAPEAAAPAPEVEPPAVAPPPPKPAPAPVPAPPAPAAEAPVAPAPPPPDVKPAPGRTESAVAVVGTLEGLRGDVRVGDGPGVRGQAIRAGQEVETFGPGSRASVRVGEDLSVELASDTRMSAVGPELSLARGSLRADAERSSFAVVTPRARAEARGGKLRVRAGAESTWLDVERGPARFARREDGAALEVAAGHCAAVAPGLPFQAVPQETAVDQVRVDQAIARGLEFLKGAKLQGPDMKRSEELVLWTYVHAGVPEKDPEFKRLLDVVLKDPLEKTYNVALQAMLLEEIDRVKYQPRIVQCAQFLVDNQCKNGQWSYGEPTAFAEGTPTPSEPRDVASGPPRKVVDFSEPKSKPKVVRKVPVRKQKDGPPTGDNSNSQYAALGLRACHDAGVILPRDVVERAREWWIKCQAPDEAADNGYGGVRGWGYRKVGPKDDPDDDKDGTLGSMTAGAVGSLVICDYILGADWKKNPAVKSGMNWLASHFTVTDNPGGKPWRHYYYLYGLERAGILFGTEKIGPRAWYAEGARFLLEAQEANGAWRIKTEAARSRPVWDTCFAILFLRRATRPLQDVASVDRPKK